jgi:pimeloyl-ACP methyl ester carboxylesterase
LLATSAGSLSEVTLGLPKSAGIVLRRVRPQHLVGLSRGLPLVATIANPRSTLRRGSSLTASVISSVVHRFSFGGDVDPALVHDVEAMIGGTGVDVLAAFAPTFLDHDKLAALPVLEKIPVTILVGSADLMTPVEHARTIAEALPDAELQVLPDVGHMVPTERPDVVARTLRRLLDRCREIDLGRNERK